jgi:predicted dehydrogenase
MQNAIRWGILGAGIIAEKFAAGLRSLPDAKLQAVASRTPARAQVFARRFEIPHMYTSYEDLVRDEDVDVVYIATVNNLHRDHSILCLEAGKAVLCEKPFTTNAAEARDVIEVARRKGLFCMEAMWMRFVPLMARLREIIASGTIGEVRMVTADLGFTAPFEKTNRFFSRELGGGAMLDLGIYPLSFVYYLLGRPAAVCTEASIGNTGIDEQAAAILTYPSGKLGIISTSLVSFLPGEAVITGTKGRITVHPPLHHPSELSLIVFPESHGDAGLGSALRARLSNLPFVHGAYARARTVMEKLTGHPRGSMVFPLEGNGYNYEAAETIRCLRAGEPESPIMPLDETLNILETMDDIRKQWISRRSQN